MFSRISSFFNDLTITRKLAIGFGTLVFLTVLVGVVDLVATSIEDRALERLRLDEEEVEEADRIEIEMLEALNDEKNFLLDTGIVEFETNFEAHIPENQEHVQTVLELVAELREDELAQGADANPADIELLDIIEQQTLTYGAAIFEVADDDFRNRGNETSGLVADLDAVFESLDEQTEASGDLEIEVAAEHALVEALEYLIGQEEVSITAFRESVVDVKSTVQRSDLTAAQKNSLNAEVDNALVIFDAIVEQDEEIAAEVAAVEEEAFAVLAAADEFIADKLADEEVALAQFRQAENVARVLDITLLSLALVTGVGLALIIARLISRQVVEMDEVFRAVAVGDFDRRSEVYSKDELGQTADGINAVLNLLVGQLGETQQQREALEQAISGLVEEVGALAGGDLSMQADVADETTGPIAEALNFAVGELRGLVSGVTTASTEVTGASAAFANVAELITEQSTSSAQLAEQAALSAQQGDAAVSETISAMGRIRDNTQETGRRIKRLGEASQEISEVVRLIEEVADRTTVLALNASIQAAAAGEAGRGFAVVAEEVQRLAERATGETRRIEDIVKTIQAESNEAVVGIEAATQEVVDGSQLAQDAGDRLSELNNLIGELANLIQHLAETTSAQTGESVTALTGLSANLQQSVAVFAAPGGDGLAVPATVGGDGNSRGDGRE